MKGFIFTVLVLTSLVVSAQETINQYDSNGKRHGLWKQKYEGQDQLRYQGTFNHGKETGVFKHYKPKNGDQPSAVITYLDNSDQSEASYFTKKGKLLSKGQLENRKRIGVWEYYHSNSDAVMMKETYENDILNGLKTTYFDNGVISEEANYVNGKKQGSYKLYSEKSVLLQDLNYVNDELHGKATYYNGKSEKIIEGQYKEDRKNGVWKYFENGKLIEEITYPINNSTKKG